MYCTKSWQAHGACSGSQVKVSANALKGMAGVQTGKAMKSQIVQFFYQKTNGEIRQAFGTMQDEVIHDKVKGTGRRKTKICSPTGTQKRIIQKFQEV